MQWDFNTLAAINLDNLPSPISQVLVRINSLNYLKYFIIGNFIYMYMDTFVLKSYSDLIEKEGVIHYISSLLTILMPISL